MHDSRDFGALTGFFDLILVDAPCSGEGLFRKDPGAAEEWSEEHIQLCAGRQKRILADAVGLLAPEGLLLYCTCTYNQQENEENAQWLKDTFGLNPEPLEMDAEWGISQSGLGYQFFPHRVRGEGFYLAAFRKSEGQSYNGPKLREMAPKGYQALPRKQKESISKWIKDPESLVFFQHATGQVIALPEGLQEPVTRLSQSLSRFQAGIELGQFKNNDFVPAHALALSGLVAEAVPRAGLERESALRYLKKENIDLEGIPEGWVLATYEGLGLGWMKVLKNRINNYFPKDWRIRMALPDKEDT